MKNLKENIKKTVLAIMVVMLAMNFGSLKTYAEEDETVYELTAEETLDQSEENEEIAEMSAMEMTDMSVYEEYDLQDEEEVLAIEEEAEEEVKETEEVSWQSYTLYNYISINEGKSYISLNTQENGISAPKSPAEFQKEHGNKRYDLCAGEYEIADYDLTSLVLNVGGFSFVEKSVAKEGQPYFIARLDRVEAVAAANFRPSSYVEGIISFTSLDNSHITFHRNWYLTLVTPMTSNKLLTGVRFGDGKNGIGDGKYYGIAFTENFQAIDSRFLPFGTKLSKDQYCIEDYDFTDLVLTYKGEAYAYRPNGPVAGDGENFHYYTVSFMKIDKLNKSTYAGGYLVENWPAWPLLNSNAAGKDGYPYLAGYYHRDYQATLMVGDAPVVIEEESIVETIIMDVEEETIAEENAAVIEEKLIVEENAEDIEEKMIVEEAVDEIVEETVVEVSEEAAVEEIVKEDYVAADTAPVQETAAAAPAATVNANTSASDALEIKDEVAPQAEADELLIDEAAAPKAAPAAIKETRGWALINMISALLTVLAALVMIVKMNGKASKLLGIIPAALAILFFFLSGDMSGTMVIADGSTLIMILFPLASLLIAWITRNGKEENEDKESDLIESPAV